MLERSCGCFALYVSVAHFVPNTLLKTGALGLTEW